MGSNIVSASHAWTGVLRKRNAPNSREEQDWNTERNLVRNGGRIDLVKTKLQGEGSRRLQNCEADYAERRFESVVPR